MKRLCVVVPFRDRSQHLSQFAPHLKMTLDAQQIPYTLLVVEQENGKPFNRGKLLNVGFDFAEKPPFLLGEFDYYCFHDVDMLPVESDYKYCPNPTHLAARAEQFGWKLPYDGYFGGVTLFDKESFLKINGYANEYFGWGAEDDDVFNRCRKAALQMSRKNCSFTSLAHERNINQMDYNRNLQLLSRWEQNSSTDGLNSLKYRVISFAGEPLYKKITVSI